MSFYDATLTISSSGIGQYHFRCRTSFPRLPYATSLKIILIEHLSPRPLRSGFFFDVWETISWTMYACLHHPPLSKDRRDRYHARHIVIARVT
jgi:hypothetical protein